MSPTQAHCVEVFWAPDPLPGALGPKKRAKGPILGSSQGKIKLTAVTAFLSFWLFLGMRFGPGAPETDPNPRLTLQARRASRHALRAGWKISKRILISSYC